MSTPVAMDSTEIGGLLKNVYSQVREKLVPVATPLVAQLKKAVPGGKFKWGGNGVYFNVQLTRPVGMTASDGGNLPPSHVATERQGSVGIKRLYITREIDGLAITGTQSKESAYAQIVRSVLEQAKDAIQLGLQEILHGDGRAIKAICTSASTTSFTVTSPYGYASAGQGGLLIDVGQYIAVVDPTTPTTVRGKSYITAITHSGDTATVTVSPALAGATVNGDLVVTATTSDTAIDSFPNGLGNILNRGNGYADLHGISNANFPRWDTVRLTAGTDTPDANQPTEMDIWELTTRVAGRSGKDAKLNPTDFLLITTPGVERKLAESFFGQRVISMDQMMDIKGGFKAMKFCGIPLVSDQWCPAGTLMLVHLPSLGWVDGKDWGQLEFEDAGAWRFISGKDAFQTSFVSYLNFACSNRSSHGIITGYTDTNRYTLIV